MRTRFDYIFLFSVLVLTAIGSIMIFSASPTMALKLGDSYYFLKRHILYLLLGFTAFYLSLRIDLKFLKKWSLLILLLSLGFLMLVYIPGVGKKISGASRWIDLVIISLQPSEIIKFTMVLFLANILSNLKDRIKEFWKGIMPVLIIIGLVLTPIILQPDLGTSIAIAATAFIMLFVAGANIWHMTGLCGAGFAGAIRLSLSSPYRLRRLLAYINPWDDPQGVGFHIIQSLLAVGSGGLFGLGLGASRQKFFYLPQQFTDFIYAILCEELGLVGGVGVIVLFVILCGRGIKIAYSAPDRFSSLLAIGLVSWLTLQALMNIMVVVGILPTTGIPLPFISYGGTATIVNLFAVGMLLNISSLPQKEDAT